MHGNRLKEERMSISARKIIGFPLRRTPPRQPDYPTELTSEQLAAIRALAGCDSVEKLTALHAPGLVIPAR